MTINPKDYDLDELREMARKRGGPTRTPDDEPGRSDAESDWSGLDGDDGPVAGSSFRAGLYRELLPLEAAAGGLEKPYLESIPEKFAAEFVVFEWLEFLLLNSGFKGATEALSYYEAVDWITEDVESTLDDYLLGIDDASANEGNQLDMDDHMLSLVYVAKLASMA
ncbi:FlaD/FlaE family flagellar protein [Haloarculaceae archaeon H-GB2-1]|nr:FlaD/FlaE family flagellar protein [Haloarculaceae archaeon H-GB1-1]MEA5386325.1 FlaD/FlaE family flagellar protein [Haloarculaceae archaeon H-GB11]MEA5407826.1 FlaD/FlaE family flagellar protein [Haloarculaceae archaeon H-GB2-1]